MGSILQGRLSELVGIRTLAWYAGDAISLPENLMGYIVVVFCMWEGNISR